MASLSFKPDISSVEAFKADLLNAKSITPILHDGDLVLDGLGGGTVHCPRRGRAKPTDLDGSGGRRAA